MDTFGGHKKEGTWILKNAEDRLRTILVPLVPSYLETYHLTIMTLLWSALIILAKQSTRSQKVPASDPIKVF